MISPAKIGVVILAAGASTRLGEPKQAALLDGETLLDRAVRVAHEAGFGKVVVVLGAFAEEIRRHCRLMDCTLAVNAEWQQGMGSSIGCGLLALGAAPGAILLTCDMPLVTAEHLRRLAESGKLTASRYAGRNGVPAYFPHTHFDALLALGGQGGAKELLRDAAAIELTGGEWDIDTPADLARIRRRIT